MKIVTSLFVSFVFGGVTYAQSIADFENLGLPSTHFWNGSYQPLGAQFESGTAIFPNYYDTSFGGFWSQGWAYSTMRDTTTGDFSNLYSAITYNGYDQSATYAVGQNNSKIYLDSLAIGKMVSGFYVTNTTYAYKSMRDGDAFAKQFGGASGNDPDFFTLTIKGWFQGQQLADSVLFYLADYRFSDNSEDYIVNTWEWVDLSQLGNVDSLECTLNSSDKGAFGMNTPAFFCVDNFTTTNSGLSLAPNANIQLRAYPNPVSDFVFLSGFDGQATYQILEASGRVLDGGYIYENERIDTRQLAAGNYFLLVVSGNRSFVTKIIRQ